MRRKTLRTMLAGAGLCCTHFTLAGTAPIAVDIASVAEGESLSRLPPTAESSAGPRAAATGRKVDARISGVEEIVVTARKQTERLQDVPVPVSAITATALADNNQLRIQDYYTRVPGLSVAPSIQASQVLAVRGLTTGGGNPTVGIVVDDVPYGGSTALGSGLQVPDFDPSDLARVEVLRGPQGTLYGASSVGGLIKFVTIDPSTEELSGRLQAGATSVHHGDDLGYSVRGSVNLPLSQTFAIRASAFSRTEPGYVDDPALGVEDVNDADAYGGRIAALWRPSDALSVKLGALYQKIDWKGASDIFPSLGDDYEQSFTRPGLGRFETENQAYSATITAELGQVNLISLTGYNINEIFDTLDYTHILGAATPGQFGTTYTVNPYAEDQKTEKFTQELRVSVPIGSSIEWLFGAFYTDEDNARLQRIFAASAIDGAIGGEWLVNSFPTTYEEYAAFSTVTLTFTDRFDVQIGGRYSENRITYASHRTGPFVPLFQGVPSPFVIPERESKGDAFTYLLTPRLRISPDLMVYARLASGYRAGGPNSAASSVNSVPSQFEADTTRNYELGMKGDVLDDLLSFDVSAYYIDWRDVQLDLRSPAGSYFDNGARARSRGVEVSVDAHPTNGLTLSAWAAWNDAELADPFPATANAVGRTGDRLPFTGRWSGNFSVDQEFDLTALTVLLGASISYVDERLGTFRGAALGVPLPRQVYPAYARTDVRAGVNYQDWSVNLFVNNVTDRQGVLAGGFGAFNPAAFTYIQPRTVGLLLTKTF